jgi:hypothetical protein
MIEKLVSQKRERETPTYWTYRINVDLQEPDKKDVLRIV